MEKFAVDLDKVLDDFELNEDRAERFAAKSKPAVLPKVQQLPPPQPLLGRLLDNSKRDSHREGSERLRRINLLDADFAPDPVPVHVFFSGDDRSAADDHFPSAQVHAAPPAPPPAAALLANGESEVPEYDTLVDSSFTPSTVPSGGEVTGQYPVVGASECGVEDLLGTRAAVSSVPPLESEAEGRVSVGESCQNDAMGGDVLDFPEGDSAVRWKELSFSPLAAVDNSAAEPKGSSDDVLNNGSEGATETHLFSSSDRPVELGGGVGVCVPCLDVAEGDPPLPQSPLLAEPVGMGEEVAGVSGVIAKEEGEVNVRNDAVVKNGLPPINDTRPISFQIQDELSEADFVKYLEELEEEEVERSVEQKVKSSVEEGTRSGPSLVLVGGVAEEERESEVPRETLRTKMEACREEAWEEEGSGSALLDGASVSKIQSREETEVGERGANAPEVTSEEPKEPEGRVGPLRPDTLSLGGVVSMQPRLSSTTAEEEDEDNSIPIPLVIGPPGATPANPRPPSDIAHGPIARVDEPALQTIPQVSSPPADDVATAVATLPTEAASIAPTSPSDLDERVQGSSPASSSSSDAAEGGGGGPGVGDNNEEEDDSSSPDAAPRQAEAVSAGLEAEGGSLSSPEAQLALDVAVEDSRLSHGSALALGDVAPFWVPDADAPACMLCMAKFTLIKRRHHCRACGKVLCSKCCSSRARLAYMDHSEARVCAPCQSIIQEAAFPSAGGQSPPNAGRQGRSSDQGNASDHSPPRRPAAGRPDPNNPMEYCSTVPPLEQVGERARAPPPSVMVPVGVLKREGSSSRSKGEAKQVMFSDGIRPGGDLSDLDRSPSAMSASSKVSTGLSAVQRKIANRLAKRLPGMGPPGSSPTPLLPAVASSRIPGDALPPMVVDQSTANGLVAMGVGGGAGEYNFEEGPELDRLTETLMDESEPPVAFALSKNFFVLVKIITLDCCVNRVVWSFTTRGMRCVGQDEVVVLLEWLPSDKGPPRDIFCHLSALYEQASKGNTVTELGHSTVQGVFLGTHNHGGFLYIRATFQCLRRLPLPPPPYLFGLLLHRMETPWAKVFPIRVMLRLGAEFRYYPCPLVGIRGREPVYHQIGHTIMNLLSDFRNFAYILPSVRGMVIHMEERQTSILLPRNRLSQVERALDDSDDHVLALAASFSSAADSHLVCVQGEAGDASTGSSHYHTQAINIQNKPRKVTGASFVVFNGALKVSAKLTAKSSIVEDGLMVQVLPDTLTTLRTSLRNGEDFVIPCGPISPVSPPAPPEEVATGSTSSSPNTPSTSTQPNIPDEVVIIRWVDNDKNFNIGVKSPIDGMALDGVPSIRVHNGTNYVSDTKFIRWTEVFLIQQNSEALPSGRGDTMDVSRISESIAHAVCLALHPYLDLLWSHALTLIAVRATLGPDSEGYEAGCGGSRLPPIYMNSLDNELVGVLHRIESRPQEGNLVLELLFHLMEL